MSESNPHPAPAPARSLRSSPQLPRLFGLIWPLYLELCLGIAVGLVGTGLAAGQSDAAGAAFGQANQIGAMLFVLFRLVGAGVSVSLTQRLGSGQREAADAVARAALGASTLMGGLTGLGATLGAAAWLHLMNTPAEVAELALPLLQLLGLAMLLDAWNASMAAVVRAHLRGRDALAVIVSMHALHLLLMQPLMLGWGSWPGLGLPGFALALLLSRALGLGLHLMLWRWRLNLRPRWSDAWRLPRAELASVLRIGLPAAAEEISWRVCFMVCLGMVGLMGTQALAAHAYVLQVMNALLLFGGATGVAVEIALGHLVGAGALHAANRQLRQALARGLVVVTLMALAAALAGPWLMGWFSRDPAVVALGARLLWFTVLVETGRIFNLVVINALRAAGDVRFPLLAGLVSMPLVMVGGAWFLGVHLGWGLPGLWLAYAADEWIRGLLMWRRWATLAWVPQARAVRHRLYPRRGVSAGV